MSTNWSAGYVTEINYTSGYYGELNPVRCRLPLLLAGYHPPTVQNACELGFGQGMSIAIHTAAQPGVHWHGTDFNPAQAAFASDLVRSAGADARLHDEAFSEFCSRGDLPDFDFIGLHGIWSWISDENRQVLVDFVRRKLRPGGVLYISYNTLPGWSASAPIRHLMKRHAAIMSPPGEGVVGQTDAALAYIDQFLGLDPLYARHNPAAVERLKNIKGQNRKYVAHEYMNRDWHPMYFADLEAWLGDAKVGFAVSANTLDSLSELNMTVQQAEFLRATPDPSLRETLRDFCANQQFRRDYWVRGLRPLTEHEQAVALRGERIVLTVSREGLPTKVRGALTEAALNEGVYKPLFEILLDHKPRTVGEVADRLQSSNVSFPQLKSALAVLLGIGVLQPAVSDAEVERARPRTEALNRHIASCARFSGEIAYFVSPVIAGGVTASRFPQLFWLARSGGAKTSVEWAEFASRQLQELGQSLIKEGVALSPEQGLAELKAQAEQWGEQVLPVWTALGI